MRVLRLARAMRKNSPGSLGQTGKQYFFNLMKETSSMKYFFPILISSLVALSGCVTTQEPQSEAVPPAETKKTEAKDSKAKDSKKAEAADNSQPTEIEVKGGKVVGSPASNSKFKNLRLGMSRYVIEKRIGQPDDMQHHVTGKAYNPFYFGTDRVRYTAYYKGSGVLVFSGQDGAKLVEIHHNAKESGDRSLR